MTRALQAAGRAGLRTALEPKIEQRFSKLRIVPGTPDYAAL